MKRTNEFFDKKKVTSSLLVSALFALTLFLFGPSNVYFTNSSEFQLTYDEFFLILAFLSVGGIILLTSILLIFKFSVHKKAVSIVFALGLLLYLQSNILVWKYPVLDGSGIDWDSMIVFRIIDGTIWLLIIILTLIKSSYIYDKIVILGSIAFIFIQGINTTINFTKMPEVPNFKRYFIVSTDQFTFSSQKNIIILTLDMFQSDIFQEIISEDNSFKDIFDGFTYFRNSLGGFPTTKASITLILSGKHYDNQIKFESFKKRAFTSSSSIPKLLKSRGCQVDIFRASHPSALYYNEKIASNFKKIKKERQSKFGVDIKSVDGIYNITLIDITLFKLFPHFFKQIIFNSWKTRPLDNTKDKQNSKVVSKPKTKNKNRNEPKNNNFLMIDYIPKKLLENIEKNKNKHGDLRITRRMILKSKVVNKGMIFKFYHLLGAHFPFNMNEEFEFKLAKNNRDGYKEQAKFALRNVDVFFKTLKEIGVYDNSLIFVIGDHCYPHPNIGGVKIPADILLKYNSQGESSSEIVGSAVPIILVKPFASNGDMKTSDAPVSLGDIPKTIASELGLKKEDFDNYSMFEIKESEIRKRRFLHYKWDSKWDRNYLPTCKEYIISGFSWLSGSWSSSGLMFKAGKIVKPPMYKYNTAIYFGKDGNANSYISNGFSNLNNRDSTWTDEKKAVLIIPINPPNSDIKMSVNVSPFLMEDGIAKQRVYIYANNMKVGGLRINKKGIYNVTIPKDYVDDSYLDITFYLPDAIPANEKGLLGIDIYEMKLSEIRNP